MEHFCLIINVICVFSEIATAFAIDEDEGDNAAIVYSVRPSTHFSINPVSGSLSVAADLSTIPEDQLLLRVFATDKARQETDKIVDDS